MHFALISRGFRLPKWPYITMSLPSVSAGSYDSLRPIQVRALGQLHGLTKIPPHDRQMSKDSLRLIADSHAILFLDTVAIIYFYLQPPRTQPGGHQAQDLGLLR
jgi:hypothetical protein